MSRPFEVEVEVGAAQPLRFTLDEEWLRSDRDVRILSVLGDERIGDERARLAAAAEAAARRMVEENLDSVVSVADGDAVTFFPKQSIRWVRLRDPEGSAPRSAIGFGRRGGEGD